MIDRGTRTGSTALGPLEQRVMEALWRLGSSTPRQLLDGLNQGSHRPLAYTTVTTILARLHEKGLVDRQPAGRVYLYVAAVGPDDLEAVIGRRDLARLLNRYGAAAVVRFAEDLLSAEPELRDRLARLAASQDGREGP